MPRIVSILSALLLLLAACSGGGGHPALSRAEAVMEQHPDSALAILDTLNPSALTSDASQAKYALLLTQAQIKNRDFPKSDSLINTAVAFFEGKGNADEMKSLFYQGNVRYFNSEYSTAIIPALHAHDLAIKLNDDYWRAKTAEQIADIYTSTSDDNTDFRREAISYYEKAGKIPNHRYAICDLATTYINHGRLKLAIHLLDSVAAIASAAPADSGLLAYDYDSLLDAYIRIDSMERADTVAQSLLGLYPYYRPRSRFYSNRGLIYTRRGDYSAALQQLSLARAKAKTYSDRIVACQTSIEPSIRVGAYNEVGEYADSVIDYANAACYELLKQSAMAAQKDFFQGRASAEAEKSRALTYIVLLTVLAALIVVVALIVIFRLRLRLKSSELERSIDEIHGLTAELQQKQSDISELKLRITTEQRTASQLKSEQSVLSDTSFFERLKLIDMLCTQYYERDNEEESHRTMLRIEQEINGIRSGATLQEIERSVNSRMDNILDRLRLQCPFLKDRDILFISMLYAGLSPKAICLLMEMRMKSFYSKRSRLEERIASSSAPDKALFLAKIRN